MVAQLVDMGFSQNASRRAVGESGNSGVEAATEWVFAHAGDTDIDAPYHVAAAAAAAGGFPGDAMHDSADGYMRRRGGGLRGELVDDAQQRRKPRAQRPVSSMSGQSTGDASEVREQRACVRLGVGVRTKSCKEQFEYCLSPVFSSTAFESVQLVFVCG